MGIPWESQAGPLLEDGGHAILLLAAHILVLGGKESKNSRLPEGASIEANKVQMTDTPTVVHEPLTMKSLLESEDETLYLHPA
jgi:hypothetical protein